MHILPMKHLLLMLKDLRDARLSPQGIGYGSALRNPEQCMQQIMVGLIGFGAKEFNGLCIVYYMR